MATQRQTTLEIMDAQLRPQSNHNLVEIWNRLQADQRNLLLVPLVDILKERGIKARRGREIEQRWVSDAELDRLRKTGTTLARIKPAKPVVEKITPKLNVDRVVHGAGQLLLNFHGQSLWTVETVNPIIVKRTPGLAKTLRSPMKKRLKATAAKFIELAWKWFRVQVCNVRLGSKFKALIRIGSTLVELVAGVHRGEGFVHAHPVKYSDLTEVR